MARVIARVFELLSSVLLLGLIAVTGVDVIGRYFLNAPLAGAFELTEVLLAGLVFAALPLVGRAGGHVDVDIATAALPGHVQRKLALLISLCCGIVLLVFAWRLGILGYQQMTEGTRTDSLGIPFAPLAFFGAAACLLAVGFAFRKGPGDE